MITFAVSKCHKYGYPWPSPSFSLKTRILGSPHISPQVLGALTSTTLGAKSNLPLNFHEANTPCRKWSPKLTIPIKFPILLTVSAKQHPRCVHPFLSIYNRKSLLGHRGLPCGTGSTSLARLGESGSVRSFKISS